MEHLENLTKRLFGRTSKTPERWRLEYEEERRALREVGLDFVPRRARDFHLIKYEPGHFELSYHVNDKKGCGTRCQIAVGEEKLPVLLNAGFKIYAPENGAPPSVSGILRVQDHSAELQKEGKEEIRRALNDSFLGLIPGSAYDITLLKYDDDSYEVGYHLKGKNGVETTCETLLPAVGWGMPWSPGRRVIDLKRAGIPKVNIEKS